MRWSKLKATVESRFAPAVRGLVTLHQARYRTAREELGRVWLAVDGQEIAEFSAATGLGRRYEVAEQLREIAGRPVLGIPGQTEQYYAADTEARRIARLAGEQTDDEVVAELEASLSLSIDDAVASPSPLIRALARLDRRVGKRRLRALAAGAQEHPLVRRLYEVRCRAEGIRAPGPAA